MITVNVIKDPATGDFMIHGCVPAKDLKEINLDPIDQQVVRSPEESAADVFQTLEILARRQMEQIKDA